MFTVSKSRSPCFRYDISVMDSNFDMDEIAELTLRWSRHSIRYFSKWEVNELHNEAFIPSRHSSGMLYRLMYAIGTEGCMANAILQTRMV